MKPIKLIYLFVNITLYINSAFAAHINFYDTDSLDALLENSSVLFKMWYYFSSISIFYSLYLVIKFFFDEAEKYIVKHH